MCVCVCARVCVRVRVYVHPHHFISFAISDNKTDFTYIA
jgi:hypothetical protein